MAITKKTALISKEKSKTAVIYCRVSSKRQADGVSLSSQEKLCREYCETHNFECVNVFRDTFSGTTINRQGLDLLFKFIQENDVGYCIIYQIDRATRWELDVYTDILRILKKSNVELRDYDWVIRQSEVKIKQIGNVSLEKYDWNRKGGSKTAEILKAVSSGEDRDKILQNTIPKEIEYTLMGLQQRDSLYGYENKRVDFYDLWIKGTIQIPHPIEWPLMKRMFEMRADGIKSDKEIADEINSLWYVSRPWYKHNMGIDGIDHKKLILGKPITAKKIQQVIQYTKYAWVLCEEWTNYEPIRAKYEWLVSIDLFNRANKWVVRISENNKTKKISIFYDDEVVPETKPEKRPRTIHRPDFVYRKVIYSPYGEVFPRWSLSEWSNGKKYGQYHCVVPFEKARQGIELPKPTKTGYSFNCPRDIFEHTVFAFFDLITPEPEMVDFFIEYVDSLWNARNINEKTEDELRNHKKMKLESELSELLEAIENLGKRASNPAIDMILEWKYNKFNEIQKEFEVIKNYQPKEQLTDRDKFKIYARNLMENLGQVIRNIESEELLRVIFQFVFERTPYYDELLNFTAPIFPVFRLNLENQQKNDSRTQEKASSIIDKHYKWKPKKGAKSKAMIPGQKDKSRTKINVSLSLNKEKKEDPSFDESSVMLNWQPQLESNRPRRIWSPEF